MIEKGFEPMENRKMLEYRENLGGLDNLGGIRKFHGIRETLRNVKTWGEENINL